MAQGTAQTSGAAATNPLLSRLSLQTQELLQFYNLPEEQKQQIFGLIFSTIQPKLVFCDQIADQLTQEVRAQQKTIDEVGIDFDGEKYILPNVQDVQQYVATFLTSSKSTLADLLDIFAILFTKEFKKDNSFVDVSAWAKASFGDSDPLTKLLDSQEDTWINKIFIMTDAMDHPGGKAGVLHVKNFHAVEDETNLYILEPIWNVNSEEATPIAHSMDLMVLSLLDYCEDVLIACLEKFDKVAPMKLVEIPEKQRDTKSPLRYKMTPDQSKANTATPAG